MPCAGRKAARGHAGIDPAQIATIRGKPELQPVLDLVALGSEHECMNTIVHLNSMEQIKFQRLDGFGFGCGRDVEPEIPKIVCSRSILGVVWEFPVEERIVVRAAALQ